MPLGFAAILAGGLLLVAGVTGSSLASVAKGAPDKTRAAAVPSVTGAPNTTLEAEQPPAGGAVSGHGFVAAPGTNYSKVNATLVQRLERLGRGLGVTLRGISGYRTPEHSVAVGGFANDPHTRGEASDTEGTQGLSKATLNKYGLERPFPGAGELDHIELLGAVTTFGGY